MFGTYPQIASYIQTGSDASVQNDTIHHESLPAYLHPCFQPPQFWSQGRGKHCLSEDFIMVAEFSELEGPKPLMTIPKDVGANFDQNAFAVRILAVDCQNSAESFSISEDAQIVMTDIQTGVFAFVHHLVLYDNTARGFVRPYCIAYITADQRKIMHFYEELSHQFRKVARYLKYGNKMLFVGDLERHLRDLEYTKNFLLNQVSKIRLRNVEESNPQVKDVRRNAENELYQALHMIQESSIEIKKIIFIFKPLLLNRRLEARFKMLEERAFHRVAPPEDDRPSLQDGWFNDLSGLDELNTKCNSVNGKRISPLTMFRPREYKPVLVKTKKAKRFNAPLRGLHELCSWGAKEGLRKLRYIHEYFKRDMTMLELEKHESRLFYPNSASISHGQCITGNFLSDVQMNRFDTAGEMEQSWSLFYNYNWGFAGSVESLVSFISVVSHPTSLNEIEEASPSSDQSFERQSTIVLDSVSTSPVREFSLLANHEYYPGMDEENTSGKSFKNDDHDCISKTLMPESDENYFQENQSIFYADSNENKAEVIKRTLSRRDSQILESDQNVDLNRTLNICPIFPSESRNKVQEITHTVKNTFMEYELETNISEKSETPLAETNSLDIVQDNSNCKVKNKCTKKHLVRRLRPDVLACEGTAIQSYVCSENCCQESLFAGGKETSHRSDASLDNSAALNYANIDPQSHSHPEQVSENVALTDSSIKSGVSQDGLSMVLVRKIKSPKEFKFKIDSSTSEDNYGLKHTGNIQAHMKSQIKKDKSSNFLKPDENMCFGFSSSISAPEDILTDSETTQAALTSSWILKNGGVFDKNLDSESVPEINIKLTADDISKNSSASKLSNLLSQNQRRYAHQITEQTRSHNRKICPTRANHELRYRRVRSESDVTSVLTTSSADEIHPHLLDERDGPPNTRDNFQTHGLSERFEAADLEDDYVGIQFSHHSGVWKPRCGVYAVGDWINNLTFGRPGYGLSEVLSTYQKLEHVIFSLLCGRPVLVVGPAKLEQDVVKLVNALSVFVPGAGRKYPAVIEWTSQCLRITDLTKLKLVGMCRPERRSADSFIPSAIKRACSIVDIEKRTISAPPYQGQFIAALLSKKKALKSDVQLLSYIQWWLMDILAKAFLFFHIFCLGSAGSILYSHSPKDQQDAYCGTVSIILTRLGVRDHDHEIIEHLTELVKMAELEPHIWLDVDPGSVVHPLVLQHKICEKFRC